MAELLLGIDLGTSGVKAAFFGVDGALMASGAAEYPLHTGPDGWVEQDARDWWQGVCTAVRAGLLELAGAGHSTAAVAVSSQAPTLLAVDRNGTPLARALIWMDRRAANEAQELATALGRDQWLAVTGNRPDPFYVAPKLLWLRRNRPEVFRATDAFLQINGYVNLQLTGKPSLDRAHAGLLQLYDPNRQRWIEPVLELCQVDRARFPAVYAGHDIIGEVTRDAARATGLPAGIPVVAGTVDGAAAAVEAGVVAPGRAAEMTGTSSVLVMARSPELDEPDAAFISMPHAVPGQSLYLGAVVASGAALRWFRDTLGFQERERERQGGDDAYEQLGALAATAPPGSEGVVFLPYLMGERSPIWDPDARGVFFGLTLDTSRAALVRSILEGTAFALKHNVDTAGMRGIVVDAVTAVGGAARSRVWNQIKADVLGTPLLQPATSLGAPFGDAVLAGHGIGIYPDMAAAMDQMMVIAERFEPDAERHQRYAQQYAVYRSLYESLRDDFRQLATLRRLPAVPPS